jgi:hypothetical protein
VTLERLVFESFEALRSETESWFLGKVLQCLYRNQVSIPMSTISPLPFSVLVSHIDLIESLIHGLNMVLSYWTAWQDLSRWH